jgi:hypothetical protein
LAIAGASVSPEPFQPCRKEIGEALDLPPVQKHARIVLIVTLDDGKLDLRMVEKWGHEDFPHFPTPTFVQLQRGAEVIDIRHTMPLM